jgi:hypothetical protein
MAAGKQSAHTTAYAAATKTVRIENPPLRLSIARKPTRGPTPRNVGNVLDESGASARNANLPVCDMTWGEAFKQGFSLPRSTAHRSIRKRMM